MVLPDSHGVSRAPRYSGTFLVTFGFRYGAVTRFGPTFQTVLLPNHESIANALQPRLDESNRFRLFPFRSPLLWESRLISFPAGTEMFHFPALASADLFIQSTTMGHDSHRVSPFRNPRIKGCLAPPRGLSQPTTSFIASRRQGIHLLPLITSLLLSFPTLFNCQ